MATEIENPEVEVQKMSESDASKAKKKGSLFGDPFVVVGYD